MGSWWPSGTVFPPLPAPVIWDSSPRGRRRTSTRAGRRASPERHNPHSIATLRIGLGAPFVVRQLGVIPPQDRPAPDRESFRVRSDRQSPEDQPAEAVDLSMEGVG